MAVRSAGLLVHRLVPGTDRPVDPDRAPAEAEGAAGARLGVEVLLAHPGGPLWARRDDGWWTVPKGELAPGEEPVAAADREFAEELGLAPPAGLRVPLGEVVQAGGKHVVAFAVLGDLDVTAIMPGTTEIEWPPRSGRRLSVPEVDRAAWFGLAAARTKLLRGQLPFLDRLEHLVRTGARPAD